MGRWMPSAPIGDAGRPTVTRHVEQQGPGVEQCVLLERVQVGRYARLRRVIVDKDVKIPQGMQIGFDLDEDRKHFTVTDDGMVVIPKRARLKG